MERAHVKRWFVKINIFFKRSLNSSVFPQIKKKMQSNFPKLYIGRHVHCTYEEKKIQKKCFNSFNQFFFCVRYFVYTARPAVTATTLVYIILYSL